MRQFAQDFGLGFHPDSPPEDYVGPDGQPFFTGCQVTELTQSLERLFQVLGDVRPYEVVAAVASRLLAESRGMKPPLHYHDPVFVRQLLQTGTREELIAWLVWNDSNGVYNDQDSLADERPPLTLLQARQILREQVERDAAE